MHPPCLPTFDIIQTTSYIDTHALRPPQRSAASTRPAQTHKHTHIRHTHKHAHTPHTSICTYATHKHTHIHMPHTQTQPWPNMLRRKNNHTYIHRYTHTYQQHRPQPHRPQRQRRPPRPCSPQRRKAETRPAHRRECADREAR